MYKSQKVTIRHVLGFVGVGHICDSTHWIGPVGSEVQIYFFPLCPKLLFFQLNFVQKLLKSHSTPLRYHWWHHNRLVKSWFWEKGSSVKFGNLAGKQSIGTHSQVHNIIYMKMLSIFTSNPSSNLENKVIVSTGPNYLFCKPSIGYSDSSLNRLRFT